MRGDLHLFDRVREPMAAACICCSKNGGATGFTLCKGSGLLDSQLAIEQFHNPPANKSAVRLLALYPVEHGKRVSWNGVLTTGYYPRSN